MTSLLATTDYWANLLSIAIGSLSVYVLLETAKWLRSGDRLVGLAWWLGGTFAAGTGLWAAAFLRLYGYVLPIPMGYAGGVLAATWACAIVTAGVALALAGRRQPRMAASLIGCLVLGVLLFAVDRMVFASVVFAPDPSWSVGLVTGAVALDVLVALCWILAVPIVATLRRWRALASRIALSAVIATGATVATSIALAAVDLPQNAVCLSVFGFEGGALRDMIVVTVPLLLACTLASSLIYGLVDQRRTALAGSLENVAARLVSANDELRLRAMLDPLTGLPNRLLFEDRLAQALLRADRAKRSVRGLREKLAVLFIDVDGFKAINDSFGHAAGDEVLTQVAERLREAARNEDTVSRIGADQFLVLAEGATSSNDCVALAMRIIDMMKTPLQIAERHVQISLSLGVVVYPDHGERNKLLAQADAAMQAAKRAGRGTYALFESHMHRDMADQLDLINDLRQAIDLGQLELHYQPKVDGRRHLICGVEALLRWHHPMRGLVSPGVFIPLAERFGLINALGNWVIENACHQMEIWARDRVHMRVAINLSVHQLREPDLVARIESALDRHHVKASQLLCEITESVAMQDVTATQRTLDDLGRIGVYLSIDDFGTGYSSLSYLRQLPARQLKIDRSFVKDLDTSDDAKAVVDGVVRLAHALGLRVVAEGVETATQRDILLGLNCDELQGYFFARPMSADKLLAWTLGHKPKGAVDFAGSLVARAIEA